MHKKHMFLRVFQKIALFACVFCAFSAWADTTTCDIDYTPVTGNSIQNGTPTPTSPVEIESVGTKVGNKYQIPVVAQGKNLFDISTKTYHMYYDASGTWTTTISFSTSDFIKVKPNTSYVLSSPTVHTGKTKRINYFDNNKTWLSQPVAKTTYPISFTTGATTEWVRFSFADSTDGPDEDIQLELGSTATPYAPYGHSATPIYLNAPLRKVGNYADVLDYKKGQIIRNVGVKVFTGTEAFGSQTNAFTYRPQNMINSVGTNERRLVSSHYVSRDTLPNSADRPNKCYISLVGTSTGDSSPYIAIGVLGASASTVEDFKTFLAQQYAAGTPVTVYYPLATPVVEQIENWSCTPPITDIKIATTKMVDEEFAAAEAKLATTVQTIESVVSRTIAQTGQIQVLQDTKQTRPDENCPANMKCLLVQDEDGTPHWYPIIEP